MSKSERMAPVDTTWLRMERPTNLMIIVGILVLAGPLNIGQLESTLAKRILAIPRFRQRTETRPTGLWWSDDEHFDIARHIKRIRLPGDGKKAELEKFVGDLASTPLDPEHPRWQFHIIEDYEHGAAIVARIHHAIGDGIAMIGVLLSLTDGQAHRARPKQKTTLQDCNHGIWADLIGPIVGTVEGGLRRSIEVLRSSLEAAASPAQTLREGTGIAAELAYLTLMPNDSPTRFKGVPSGSKCIAWSDPIALPEVRAVSNTLGCSINDMLLAAVAGALNGYLADKGDETEGIEVRALVPVNLRPPGTERELGNHFGVVAVELPVGLENPLARVIELHRRMEALKSSYEPPVTLGLLEALGYAPQAVQDTVFDLLLSRATAVMTNLPGPQTPLYLAGSEIKQVMFWVPQAGNIGMGVSILSFNGRVQFGLITDRALVPDPKAIVVRFEPEFEQLLYYVLLHASSDGSVPKVAEAEPVRERRRTKRKIKSAAAAARRKKNSRQHHDR
jgi:WS/DGAT/MGAT family acyltransferase